MSRLPGTGKMETDESQYAIAARIGLTIFNTSSAEIVIPFPRINNEAGEQTFRFYKKTSMGWARLDQIPGLIAAFPVDLSPGLVISSGSEAEIDISPYLNVHGDFDTPLTGTLIVQTRYSHDELGFGELVQYSNEFQIGETGSIDATRVTVDVTQTRSLVFSVSNNSDMPIWILDQCSPRGYGRSAFSNDNVLGLQRLTDEKTWQIIRTSKTDCIDAVEVVQVVLPGQVITINGAQWFQATLAKIPAGTYRWDVAFYVDYKDDFVRDVHHIFSKTFEYGQ